MHRRGVGEEAHGVGDGLHGAGLHDGVVTLLRARRQELDTPAARDLRESPSNFSKLVLGCNTDSYDSEQRSILQG